MQSISLPMIFSLITTVISGIFAVMVLPRWRSALAEGKQRPHLRAWGIGLTLYCIGSLSQVVLSFVWSPLFFGLWYWTGALAVAPWLGQGTVYLLIRRGNIARNIEMALMLVCVMTLPWAAAAHAAQRRGWQPGVDMNVILHQVMQPDKSRSMFVARDEHVGHAGAGRRRDLLGDAVPSQADPAQPHDRQLADRGGRLAARVRRRAGQPQSGAV